MLDNLESFKIFSDFKRPEHLAIPTVWHEFTRKDVDGNIQKYVVQDITEDRMEEIAQIMAEKFTYEEVVTKSLCVKRSNEMTAFFKDMSRQIMNCKTAMMCLVDDLDSGEGKQRIAGVTLTAVKNKSNEKAPPPQGVQNDKSYAMMQEIMDRANIWERYNVEQYVVAYGLYVLPELRGQGLAAEILIARKKLTKALGLKVTANTFSSLAVQKSAVRAGYEELVEVKYDELSKLFNVPLPGLEGKSNKVYAAVVD